MGNATRAAAGTATVREAAARKVITPSAPPG